ncbi:MAG: Ig-like domain-containing protein, partial [bacterium]
MRTSLKKYLWVPIIVTLACGGGDLASPISLAGEDPSLNNSASVTSVSVTLASSVDMNDSTIATFVANGRNGRAVNGRPVTWSSRNAGIAKVSNQGVVTGVAVGTATIDAVVDGITGSASVAVTQPVNVNPSAAASLTVTLGEYSATTVGQTTQATARVLNATGTEILGAPVTWVSTDERIATINGLGNVTARSTGIVTITGTTGTVSGTATYTVASVSVASVATVALSTTTNPLTVGGASQSTATLRDASGNLLSNRLVTWSSSNAGVATVDAAGMVQSVSAGSATITAVSEGKVGTLPMSVVAAAPVAVASVSVSAPATALQIAATTQASAVAKDASGNVLTGRTMTWTSSAPAIATVSTSGLVTAVAAGSATITATSGSASGTIAMTVSAA